MEPAAAARRSLRDVPEPLAERVQDYLERPHRPIS